jgi:hypothetical protein
MTSRWVGKRDDASKRNIVTDLGDDVSNKSKRRYPPVATLELHEATVGIIGADF